ncbi:mitochondrial carrier domain-containing protein [Pyronema omphalodes]|nr:mitochondrial carrier domain-containing protein [Pyronema omphalodes]
MSDFIAGYVSGAFSILIGSPLDIIKSRLQASSSRSSTYNFPSLSSYLRGTTPPLLTYGALNSILFATYNRTLPLLPDTLTGIWLAGAAGGLTSFILSAPTEVVKTRAQVTGSGSWEVTRGLWRRYGLRGLYLGGTITAARDAIGYGWYFAAYEGVRRCWVEEERDGAAVILFAGGVAGVATWASIYPLDVVKTRVQTQVFPESRGEIGGLLGAAGKRSWHGGLGARQCARMLYREAGYRGFFDGMGVCMARAFLVNAVQWAIYEYMMRALKSPVGLGAREELQEVA